LLQALETDPFPLSSTWRSLTSSSEAPRASARGILAKASEIVTTLVPGNVIHSIVRRKKVNKKDKLMLVFFVGLSLVDEL
jgi:hypothetical protein